MWNDPVSPTTVVTPSPLPGRDAPTITPDRVEPLYRGLAGHFEEVIGGNQKTFEACCPVALASIGPEGVETNKEDTEKISQPTMVEKVSLQVEADQKGSAFDGEAPCSSGTQPGFEKPDATSIGPDITLDPLGLAGDAANK